MTGGGRRRTGWPWVLALVGLVAIVVLGGQRGEATPFDPRSTEPDGTKALVELLEDLGADVTITDEVPDADPSGQQVLAVVRDDSVLSEAQVEAIDGALAGGATVVITDPFSPLTPIVADEVVELGIVATESTVEPGECTIDPLSDVGAVELFATFTFEVEATSSCYGDDESAFVTVTERNGGNLVAYGGTTPFTNEYLGRGDNAAAIANLLAPVPGNDVILLEDDVAAAEAAGDLADSPFDLVDSSVVMALMQLGIAFVLYGVWRARRLGRPLREVQPVEIAGSELVAAVGDLLHRTRDPRRAARLLRDDTRGLLGQRFGLPRDAPIETLAATVAARTGVDADRVTTVLSTLPVTSDDDLVSLARQIESLRQEILHEHVD